MGTHTTRRFGELAVSIGSSLDEVPTDVLAHLKLCVLDTLGCGLFGSILPWSRMIVRVAGQERFPGHGAEGTAIWGHSREDTLSATGAALVNGTAAHSFELDDLHPASVLHPGAVSISSALATAGYSPHGCSGRDFLAAALVGYEIGTRIGMAAGTAHLTRGWHPTGTHGTFAASVAAGTNLGLSSEAMSHALAIGGSQSAGLLATQRGAMAKRLHAGRAAESGVLAALLAAEGFTGAEDLLEAEYGGYYTTFSDMLESEPRITLPVVADDYETMRVGFKPFACGGSTHTAVEAMQGLLKEGLEAEEVKEILLECTTATQLHGGWRYGPEGTTAAQMNLGYCVAVTLLERDAFVEQFRRELLYDSRVVELASRVTVIANPELDALGSGYRHSVRVTVHTNDGRTLSTDLDHALGSSKRPMTRGQVVKKYRRLAGYALDADAVAELEESVLGLEDIEDVGILSSMLQTENEKDSLESYYF